MCEHQIDIQDLEMLTWSFVARTWDESEEKSICLKMWILKHFHPTSIANQQTNATTEQRANKNKRKTKNW